MDKLLAAADKALSFLPFNGDKTVLSMALKFALPLAVAHFPFLLVVAPFVDAAADLGIALGLSHKMVKAAQK